GALALSRVRGRWLFKAAAGLVTLAIGAQLFLTGTRHIFAVVALPAIGLVYLGTPPRFRGRTLALLVVCLALLYSGFQVQRYARVRGFRQIESERVLSELANPRGHQLF